LAIVTTKVQTRHPSNVDVFKAKLQ